ncbi:L-serine ammonia-lyase, iron-sulfur-dependent, subunit alpha (plasmid) [Photobacterium sp. DA100]|uniref:L-serine ammonia-lyase, iron-sulfur-dependent, subunit alpha n=1 Tax=Photobacterium sp. DA100 TaxID=3027472 RepID=UPI002479247E|nr:L-serine ammonia-lyase, iron-sulfur-dependent, subunit alpha [Photobacterium sp. DA100]WEM44164.1 L-serine ammonia-lyase, iron-sulfur-dependent, subunit alpha [Photobacterium sp. DA100]
MSIELYPSFFNDVMAPVMLAGSSSHLAAPQRLGLLTHFLAAGEAINKIEVIMDEEGSFAGTFGLMSEDIGMCAGAIGLPVDSPERNECHDIARECGIEVVFTKAPMKETDHLNGMKFEITTRSGKVVSLVGDSIGGGMIQTKKIMGFDYIYKGDINLVLVIKRDGSPTMLDGLKSKITGLMDCSIDRNENGVAYFFTTTNKPNLQELKAQVPECEVYFLECILPTPTLPNRKPQLFDNSTKFVELSQNRPMHEIAIDYQIAATGMTREEILKKVDELRVLMVRQVEVMADDIDLDYMHCYGFDTGNYKRIVSGEKILDEAQYNAVKHYFSVLSMAPNTPNVGFPHGAGGGVVMSCLRAAQIKYGFSDEKMVEGLLVAAAYGAIAYTRTDPTGETIGCAGEMGLSGVFASTALTYILGGTPEQVESAASMAMQLAVGWPCDPIAGANGDPCTTRGMAVVTLPFTYAQLALVGHLTPLPFHEILDVATEVAGKFDSSLLCTGRGGCAGCPTACSLKKELGV